MYNNRFAPVLENPKLHQLVFVYTDEEDTGVIFFDKKMYHAGYLPCRQPHDNNFYIDLIAQENKAKAEQCEIIVKEVSQDWSDIAYYPQPWGAFQMIVSQQWFEDGPLI